MHGALKIALCGLDDLNLGDEVIFKSTRWLLGGIMAELGLKDFEIVRVDLMHDLRDGVAVRKSGVRLQQRRLADMTTDLVSRFPSLRLLVHSAACPVLRWKWRHSRSGRSFVANELCKLHGADLIVFAGGGLVKFHRQNFYSPIDDVTRFAKKNRIPVLFNAVGVEGYDIANPKCTILKQALRRDCVRMVTTRDDAETLKREYGLAPQIPVSMVGDPALWVPEVYNVAWQGEKSGVIGLNAIRPAIFGGYGEPINPEELLGLYRGLVRLCLKNGFKVQVFTNGALADNDFARSIIGSCEDLKGNPQVSICLPTTDSELISAISGYERFLAARLHASIIGTSMGIPNASLVWNRKQRFFGAAMGTGENYLERGDFNPETVFATLMAARGCATCAESKKSTYELLRRGVAKSIGAGEDV